jgi:succinate dehydrogenase / fumarate reductase membrane anchor subunit
MVKSVTSLTRNGLRDWLIQHISAALIGSYTLFLFTFILLHPHMSFDVWQGLFCHTAMRIITVLVLIAVMMHVYIGMWTISTDYLNNTAVRLVFQVIVFLALIAFLVWGIVILWGV